jgi:mRNA-degrading endonuclease RelE of RelBE toxin-antitoxin system
MAVEGDSIKISIRKTLAIKLKKRLKETEFKTLSEYVNFILEEVMASLEEQEEEEDSGYSAEEEEKVKQRLKDLGYID